MEARNETGNTAPNVQTAFNPLLETFIPGFSLVSGIFSSYFQIDVTYYILSFCILLAVATGIKHCSQILWTFISEYILSTAEIRYDDEIYNYLMFWVSKQNFSRSTTQFVAGTQTSSSVIWTGEDSDDKNIAGLDGEEYENLDDQPANWDKIKAVHYTPSAGTHFFRYRGRILSFTRQKEENQTWFGRSSTETIYISCLGRNPQPLKDLLQDAQVAYHERDGNRTVIYRGSKPVGGSSDDMEWVRCLSRPPRPLSTVVLDEAQKQMIVEDMKEYLHPYTRRWYSNRGIPYRRGYLFHGPPGTGKTSLCFAVAGLLNLRIYVVSLNSRSLTEDSLANLFRELPWRCIVLLEDIDSAGITAKRSEEPKADDTKPGDASGPSSGSGETNTSPKGITLSGFLNIIDGVASSEGRILVMTTNHIEKLDPAILRPGRVDSTIRFGYADAEMIRGIYKAIFCNQEASKLSESKETKTVANGNLSHANGHARSFSAQMVKPEKASPSPASNSTTQASFHYRHHSKTDEEIEAMADEFAERMPSGEFTPAELQGYLLKHKNSPEKALEGVEDFAKAIREEKELRKKGTPSS